MSYKTTKWCSFCRSDIIEPELSISMAAYEAFWRRNQCYICNHTSLGQPKNETEAIRVERELRRELQEHKQELQNYKTQLQKKIDEANDEVKKRENQSEESTKKTFEKIKEILEEEYDRKHGGGLYEKIRIAEESEREDQLKEIIKQALEESED